jgi:alpha/beta hydrolase family protein
MEVVMRMGIGAMLVILALAVVALVTPSPVTAEGLIGQPRTTPVGTFGGIAYVQHDGLFEGQTSTGAYRVPYRITAPLEPVRGNRTVLIEPPHPIAGMGMLERELGRSFLFSRGFAHAGIGWSTTRYGKDGDNRIVDPTAPGVFIEGGFKDTNGRTDDEIIADFGRALMVDATARRLLGPVERRYVAGFSDSSDPILRLVTSGKAAGAIELAFPMLAVGHDPQAALADGRYAGKVVALNSEGEGASTTFVDRGVAQDQYRFYAVAGTPHIADPLVPFVSNRTTPASYQPEVRAHFLQGHEWVRGGARPVLSTRLKVGSDGTLVRDANGNAISIDVNGQTVPRLPYVELGEAHFISGFIGSYEAVKTIAGLGFANHAAYLRAFDAKLNEYVRAGYILKEDADEMRRRAALCPPRTLTETYRDHYDAFVAIAPCGG